MQLSRSIPVEAVFETITRLTGQSVDLDFGDAQIGLRHESAISDQYYRAVEAGFTAGLIVGMNPAIMLLEGEVTQ